MKECLLFQNNPMTSMPSRNERISIDWVLESIPIQNQCQIDFRTMYNVGRWTVCLFLSPFYTAKEIWMCCCWCGGESVHLTCSVEFLWGIACWPVSSVNLCYWYFLNYFKTSVAKYAKYFILFWGEGQRQNNFVAFHKGVTEWTQFDSHFSLSGGRPHADSYEQYGVEGIFLTQHRDS